MKKILLTLLLLASALFSEAWGATDPTCTFPRITIINSSGFPTVYARDAPLPRVLPMGWMEGQGTGITNCTNVQPGVDFIAFAESTIPASSANISLDDVNYRIFESGVDGVGIIMEAADANGSYQAFSSSSGSNQVVLRRANTSTANPTSSMRFRAKFVATKRLAAGPISIPQAQVMRVGLSIGSLNPNGGSYLGWGQVLLFPTAIVASYPSCILNLPSQVNLPQINTSKMKTVAATAGDTSFRLSLNCSALTDGSNINVRYTLTDVSNPANVTSTLGLLSGTTATGVALQVLEDGVPVPFGPDSPVADNRNQRDFGLLVPASGHSGNLTKGLTVRYIRTNGALNPGSLTAGMTVTMSYQ